ncbi:hypothetical protein I656_00447 [Geobacillus sp. WSUCF1]|nr:hypothetical protein I656_00447 [Geobacillus sp. WSUCF1]
MTVFPINGANSSLEREGMEWSFMPYNVISQ